ncbi:hypothetical protein HMN09_01302100 [Mycena chlorophos]|uniref:C2H2-type domain-containing protein n=1 Tax=Mycena chlorophos TaxID=658473 RepID=A0A8H6VW61_MYCCL|nr:hypothetical protein HMN09_01302100 [Mycena chlorophos]
MPEATIHICVVENCGMGFSRRGDLARHQATHLSEADKEQLKHRCPFAETTGCQYATLQKGNMNIHVNIHTGAKPYTCSHATCDFAAGDPSQLNKHKRRWHPDDSTIVPGGAAKQRPGFREKAPAPLKLKKTASDVLQRTTSSTAPRDRTARASPALQMMLDPEAELFLLESADAMSPSPRRARFGVSDGPEGMDVTEPDSELEVDLRPPSPTAAAFPHLYSPSRRSNISSRASQSPMDLVFPL